MSGGLNDSRTARVSVLVTQGHGRRVEAPGLSNSAGFIGFCSSDAVSHLPQPYTQLCLQFTFAAMFKVTAAHQPHLLAPPHVAAPYYSN